MSLGNILKLFYFFNIPSCRLVYSRYLFIDGDKYPLHIKREKFVVALSPFFPQPSLTSHACHKRCLGIRKKNFPFLPYFFLLSFSRPKFYPIYFIHKFLDLLSGQYPFELLREQKFFEYKCVYIKKKFEINFININLYSIAAVNIAFITFV